MINKYFKNENLELLKEEVAKYFRQYHPQGYGTAFNYNDKEDYNWDDEKKVWYSRVTRYSHCD